MTRYTKSIRLWANWGLIGSLVIVAIAILFKYLSPMVFRQTDIVYSNLTIACSVIAIADMVVILSSAKKTKRLAQADTPLEARLQRYAQMVRSNSLLTLCATLVVSAIIILTGNFSLLMLDMMLVLMLFFTYPNMYRIKAELDLNDDQMTTLFGDQYTPEPHDKDE